MELRTALTLCASLASVCSLAHAQTPTSATELGPTRGFFQEWGQTTEYSKASVDLQTGAFDTGGGIRLGLQNSELIINSGLIGDANEAVFKLGMGSFQAGPFHVDWAPAIGLSHHDVETDNGDLDSTNFFVGAALTGRAEDLIVNLQPAIARIEVGDESDTQVELGLAAYYALPETQFGRFMPGIEFTYVNGDINDDNILSLGLRWIYTSRIVLDLVFIQEGYEDITSLPGIARLNVAF